MLRKFVFDCVLFVVVVFFVVGGLVMVYLLSVVFELGDFGFKYLCLFVVK